MEPPGCARSRSRRTWAVNLQYTRVTIAACVCWADSSKRSDARHGPGTVRLEGCGLDSVFVLRGIKEHGADPAHAQRSTLTGLARTPLPPGALRQVHRERATPSRSHAHYRALAGARVSPNVGGVGQPQPVALSVLRHGIAQKTLTIRCTPWRWYGMMVLLSHGHTHGPHTTFPPIPTCTLYVGRGCARETAVVLRATWYGTPVV